MPMIRLHPRERLTCIRDRVRHWRLRLAEGRGAAERKDHDRSLAL
jgi:hypothetical protein